MISKLDAIQFHGIKTILESRLDEDVGELAFRIMSVVRSLKGGVRSKGGITKNLMELARMKDCIDDILAIRGIASDAGDLPFDEAIKQEKARMIKEKQRKSKSHKKSPKSRKKLIKTSHRVASKPRKKKSKGKAQGKGKR